MRKATVVLLMLLAMSCDTMAKGKTLKKVMTLKIDRTGGANGANVTWDPERQKYYAAMAGNTYYPMLVYNAEGKKISDNNLETKFDVRGLWYNPTTKTLQTNGYDDFGLAEYTLDAKDMPESVKRMPIPSKQPDIQSVGAFDVASNVICFYHDGKITREDMTGAVTTAEVHLGVKKKKQIKSPQDSAVVASYNENTCIYSGDPKATIGLLNVKERQIELYNVETGLLKKILKLPPDAPAETSLNFSCSNGIYWLFDKKKREWRGYQ